MVNKILLATFIDKKNLNSILEKIEKIFSIKKDNTFIFSLNDEENFMITFKLNVDGDSKTNIKSRLKNTIQIHKKGDCFYTINALNKLIQKEFNLTEGNIEYKNYQINWSTYQNKLLLIKEDNLLVQDIKKVIL
jgi:hypothetical protein